MTMGADYLHEQARKIADNLEPFEANIIRALLHSHSMSRATNRSLHRDLHKALEHIDLEVRNHGIKEARDVVLAMIEQPGVTPVRKAILEKVWDNLKALEQLPEAERIGL